MEIAARSKYGPEGLAAPVYLTYRHLREIHDPDLEYKVLTLFTTKNSGVR